MAWAEQHFLVTRGLALVVGRVGAFCACPASGKTPWRIYIVFNTPQQSFFLFSASTAFTYLYKFVTTWGLDIEVMLHPEHRMVPGTAAPALQILNARCWALTFPVPEVWLADLFGIGATFAYTPPHTKIF